MKANLGTTLDYGYKPILDMYYTMGELMTALTIIRPWGKWLATNANGGSLSKQCHAMLCYKFWGGGEGIPMEYAPWTTDYFIHHSQTDNQSADDNKNMNK